MNKNTVLLSSILFAMTILLSFSLDSALAHPHNVIGQTMIDDQIQFQTETITPINSMIGLEKSTELFYAPETNLLPWGYIEGKVANHVDGYPIVIQIFKDNDPVHFAQTDIQQDGTYEYKFRVLSSNESGTTRIFSGDYSVNIFKVVYLDQEILESS